MQVLRSLRLWQAHDLRHHGRYGQARKWPRSSSTSAVACSWLVLLVTIALLACFDVLSGGKRALVCRYVFVGTDCAFALRGMVLLMAQSREHPGV